MSDGHDSKSTEKIPVVSTVHVTLTNYEWHLLLRQLEYLQQIINRDSEVSADLWERIATQLHGKDCVMYGSAKHRRLQPELFKEVPKVAETPKPIEEPKKPWYMRIFRKCHC